jgi:hypothetical protein
MLTLGMNTRITTLMSMRAIWGKLWTGQKSTQAVSLSKVLGLLFFPPITELIKTCLVFSKLEIIALS